MTSIIIAEDDPAVLDGLREMLSGSCKILATATNGRDLIRAAEELHPELVISDIKMPGLDGLRAARMLLANFPGLRIVFVSTSAHPELVRAALAVGACAYVLKVSAGKDLPAAIDAALRGQTFISAAAQRL